MDWGSNGEEPTSWEELYSINLIPSELFLKFRKEVQGLRVGLNLEVHTYIIFSSWFLTVILCAQFKWFEIFDKPMLNSLFAMFKEYLLCWVTLHAGHQMSCFCEDWCLNKVWFGESFIFYDVYVLNLQTLNNP